MIIITRRSTTVTSLRYFTGGGERKWCENEGRGSGEGIVSTGRFCRLDEKINSQSSNLHFYFNRISACLTFRFIRTMINTGFFFFTPKTHPRTHIQCVHYSNAPFWIGDRSALELSAPTITMHKTHYQRHC